VTDEGTGHDKYNEKGKNSANLCEILSALCVEGFDLPIF
jgi:hypothetical protein